MCKTKSSTDAIGPMKLSSRLWRTSPKASQSSWTRTSDARRSSPRSPSNPSSINNLTSGNYATGSSYKDSWQSSVSSGTSLSNIRESLSDNPHIYEFSEICAATNNFTYQRFSSSSSSTSWRCVIRGNDVIVFQRKFRRPIDIAELRERLSLICKSHHTSLIKLRGASVSGNYIYLVYDYIHGANLVDCLRNPRNPNYTILSNWISRMQIATDLAHGLDYIHHSTGLSSSFVHNHIKSSSILVSQPSLNAKFCHFGTAELCGETASGEKRDDPKSGEFKRSSSRVLKFQGTRGYMSPEFQSTGIPTQKSDVFAFGVVILELLSGEEPLRYTIDDESGAYTRTSVIETAKEAVEGGENGGRKRLRRWLDNRLKDSYPVEVAESMVRAGLDCVVEDPDARPDMGQVAGRISKHFLESTAWAEKMGVPTDFTVSLAPR